MPAKPVERSSTYLLPSTKENERYKAQRFFIEKLDKIQTRPFTQRDVVTHYGLTDEDFIKPNAGPKRTNYPEHSCDPDLHQMRM